MWPLVFGACNTGWVVDDLIVGAGVVRYGVGRKLCSWCKFGEVPGARRMVW